MRAGVPRAYVVDRTRMWRSGAAVLLIAGIVSGIEMWVGWEGEGRASGLQGLLIGFCGAVVAWFAGPRLPARTSFLVGRIFLVAATVSVAASVHAWRGTELAAAVAFHFVLVVLFAALYYGALDLAAIVTLVAVCDGIAVFRGDNLRTELLTWVLTMFTVVGTGGVIHHLARGMEELSFRDPLTGALNRRAWDRALAVELAAHRRAGRPLSVALVDIDHLKRLNDSRGHEAGDELLRAAVATWTRLLRSDDVVARLGGDEFGLLLKGASSSAAEVVARDLIEGLLEDTAATCTIGVATAEPGTAADEILAVADRLLLAGKREGRARVTAVPVVVPFAA